MAVSWKKEVKLEPKKYHRQKLFTIIAWIGIVVGGGLTLVRFVQPEFQGQSPITSIFMMGIGLYFLSISKKPLIEITKDSIIYHPNLIKGLVKYPISEIKSVEVESNLITLITDSENHRLNLRQLSPEDLKHFQQNIRSLKQAS